MTPEDLDLVVSRTGHETYRGLTADGHPHAEYYRREVRRMAAEFRGESLAGPSTFDPPLPSLAAQALSAAGALARTAAATLTGKPVLVSDDVYERRLEVCRTCPQYRFVDGRCSLCGCFIMNAKARLAQEYCPIGKWESHVA